MQQQAAGPTLHTIRVAVFGSKGVGKKSLIHQLGKKQNQNLSLVLQNNNSNMETSFHIQSNYGPCQVTLVNFDYVPSSPDPFNQVQTIQQTPEDHQIRNRIKTCDSCILMFSVLDRQTYKNIPLYFREWVKIHDNCLGVLVANKVQTRQQVKVKQKMITYHRKKNLQFYNISVTAGYNLLKPFEYLFKKNFGAVDFCFNNVENSIDMTSSGQQKYQKQISQFEEQYKMVSCYNMPVVWVQDY